MVFFSIAGVQPLSASNSSRDLNLFRDSKYTAQLSAELDEKALQQIENNRRSDPYNVVEFKLEIIIKYIKSNTRIAHIFYVKTPDDLLQKVKGKHPFTPEDENIQIAMSTQKEKFISNREDGWIISGDNSPTFLYMGMIGIECIHRIEVVQWVNDYAPKLGLGRRILFEVPSHGLLFDETKKYLTSAEDAFRRWDIFY